MPTDFEIDDFSGEKSTDDLFNYEIYLKDNEREYVYDENFLEQIPSDLDIPLFEQDNILLQDAAPDEIIYQTTTNQSSNFDSFWDSVLSDNSQSNNLTTLTADDSIKMECYSEYDTSSIHSHSPTSSQSSNDIFENINLITTAELNKKAPLNIVTSVANATNIIQQTQPIVINSGVFQMIPLNRTDKTVNNNNNIVINNNKIPINNLQTFTKNKINTTNNISTTNGLHKILPTPPQLKLPINKMKNSTSIVYPKCLPKLTSMNDLNTMQLIQSISADNNCTTNLSTSNSILINDLSKFDLKALKRQQRMIKNRESACMSRKRKKDYVISLEKKCQELAVENNRLKLENNSLKQMLATGCQNGSKLPFLNISNISSKNAAIFLMMLLMVSVNVGPIGKMFHSRTLENFDETDDIVNSIDDFHTRHLLSMSNLENITSTLNEFKKTEPYIIKKSHEKQYINQTENIRLASELRRYIGEPLYNWTKVQKIRNLKSRPWESNFKTIPNTIDDFGLRSKLNRLYTMSRRYRKLYPRENEIQIYSSSDSRFNEYAEFFNSINLKDDTFYVVSLRNDHMLYPAKYHNKTARPKMSLLMPAVTKPGSPSNESSSSSSSTQNDHITLVKIDCEITNTNLVQVNQNSIPHNLRSSLQNSTNYMSDIKTNMSYDQKNVTADHIRMLNKQKRKFYKPYFLLNNIDGLNYDIKMSNLGFP